MIRRQPESTLTQGFPKIRQGQHQEQAQQGKRPSTFFSEKTHPEPQTLQDTVEAIYRTTTSRSCRLGTAGANRLSFERIRNRPGTSCLTCRRLKRSCNKPEVLAQNRSNPKADTRCTLCKDYGFATCSSSVADEALDHRHQIRKASQNSRHSGVDFLSSSRRSRLARREGRAVRELRQQLQSGVDGARVRIGVEVGVRPARRTCSGVRTPDDDRYQPRTPYSDAQNFHCFHGQVNSTTGGSYPSIFVPTPRRALPPTRTASTHYYLAGQSRSDSQCTAVFLSSSPYFPPALSCQQSCPQPDSSFESHSRAHRRPLLGYSFHSYYADPCPSMSDVMPVQRIPGPPLEIGPRRCEDQRSL